MLIVLGTALEEVEDHPLRRLNHLIGDESLVACRLKCPQYHRLSTGKDAPGDMGDGKGKRERVWHFHYSPSVGDTWGDL